MLLFIYRFSHPQNDSFPYMIELFSRIPEIFEFEISGQLTPIPAGEDASSLSAILLDTEYYDFLHSGIKYAEGVPYASPEVIIPLKAKAWLDLSERRNRGEHVDSKDIKKHLKDIPLLFQIVSPEAKRSLPEVIKKDLILFLEKTFIQNTDSSDIIEKIESFYNLEKK